MTDFRLRFAALLIAVAFQGPALSEALRLRECPHHDAIASAVIDHEASADHAGAAQSASHAEDGGAEEHDDHGGCTCVSACDLGGSSVALAAVAVEEPAADLSVAGDVVPNGGDADLPGPPDHLHPFALGPPLALLA